MQLPRSLGWLVAFAMSGSAGCLHLTDEGQAETSSSSSKQALSASEESFKAFESGQVRPLALSPDGKYLFAVNTPDSRLEIFQVTPGKLRSVGSLVVGLEPVAVAARSNDEIWVVNHLSDSISIVDVKQPHKARVVRTLLVGDEPRDIVFARSRAFVTTAHRGQNTNRDPKLTTPSVGRADVWVFDPNALGSSLAGQALTVLELFTDTPRALAVSPNGETVYAAGFHTGNQTTVIPERRVTNFGGLPSPTTNVDDVHAPWGALVVKYRTSPLDGQMHWLDEENRVWDSSVNFSLPDRDVFAIDATLPVPALRSGPGASVSGVGTVLFDMAVNPINGKVYVANLEARNDVRFEGHNDFGGGSSVRGHIAESRITVLQGSSVSPRHLNKHIDYSQEGNPAEAAKSLAFPMGMAVSKDGKLLYVAAHGSSKLGIFRTAELEADTFAPAACDQVLLTGGGPTGIVLDEKRGMAYVLTRFDNGISIVDPKRKAEVEHIRMYNPEPASIAVGRRFLYDAAYTSAHGDSACASCHIFGDLDSLAWDLGDPDGSVAPIPGPFSVPLIPALMGTPQQHPMKGPMTTQSLRGMDNHGPMHWRGDRTGGNDVAESSQPDVGTFDEQEAFRRFNPAFVGLLGRHSQLSAEEMQAFTDFALQLVYPPNPIRNLDNSLTAAQERGRAFYFSQLPDGRELPSDTFRNCNGCHVLDPQGNAAYGVARPGFFGSDGRYSFENAPQFMKVPHLRNMYQKVGMFGMANTFGLPIDAPASLPPLLSALPSPFNDLSFKGEQIRGFGFMHSGEVDTLFRFVGMSVFVQRPSDSPFPNPGGIPTSAEGIALRRDLEAFMLAFDSNLAPVVGQQTTLTASNAQAVNARIDLLEQRARAGECELVVHGREQNKELGFLYVPTSQTFLPNRTQDATLSLAGLRAIAASTELTFTAVPNGSGRRMALDRDSDGVLDRD